MTITIKKGKTFSRVLRPTAPPFVYKPITTITNTAPVSIHVPGHGLVNGQYAAIVSVQGMKEINASNTPPAPSEYHKVTVTDADHITINDINAAEFRAYTSGGYVQYLTPINMAGATARRSFKDRVGGTTLLSLTTENGGLVIDNTAHTITETITATATAAITWKAAVSDLELEIGGVVTELDSCQDVVVEDEITV